MRRRLFNPRASVGGSSPSFYTNCYNGNVNSYGENNSLTVSRLWSKRKGSSITASDSTDELARDTPLDRDSVSCLQARKWPRHIRPLTHCSDDSGDENRWDQNNHDENDEDIDDDEDKDADEDKDDDDDDDYIEANEYDNQDTDHSDRRDVELQYVLKSGTIVEQRLQELREEYPNNSLYSSRILRLDKPQVTMKFSDEDLEEMINLFTNEHSLEGQMKQSVERFSEAILPIERTPDQKLVQRQMRSLIAEVSVPDGEYAELGMMRQRWFCKMLITLADRFALDDLRVTDKHPEL